MLLRNYQHIFHVFHRAAREECISPSPYPAPALASSSHAYSNSSSFSSNVAWQARLPCLHINGLFVSEVEKAWWALSGENGGLVTHARSPRHLKAKSVNEKPEPYISTSLSLTVSHLLSTPLSHRLLSFASYLPSTIPKDLLLQRKKVLSCDIIAWEREK